MALLKITIRYSGGLPEDGSAVPKHVGVDICYENCVLVCILLQVTGALFG
jgi:hypothetical protein